VRSMFARLLLIVLVALTPGLLLQIYAESQARQTRQHLTEDEALRLARLVGEAQQRINEGADQVLTAMGSGAFVLDDHPDICQRMLTNLLTSSPRYVSAAIIGADGRFLCPPNGLSPTANISDRPYLQSALRTGEFTIGGYEVGRETGLPTIHMAKPFRRADGTIAGISVVALNLDWLAARLADLPMPPGAAVTVRDRNGILLASFPDVAGSVGQKLPTEQRDGTDTATNPGPDGPQLLTAYASAGAEPDGLRIAVGLDAETSFATVTNANRRDSVMIAAVMVLALGGTVQLGNQLVRRPFTQMLALADRWRAGDLAARASLPQDGSEFGRLAAAFDAMAAAQQIREADLRQSEAEYRATFEQASVGMAQANLDGVLLQVNDALCAITGRPRGELLGRNFREFTHPDDQATDDDHISALRLGELASGTAEKRFIRPDGRIVWVNRCVSLLQDAEGRPARLIAVIEDISARKSAQMQLEESETRLQLARDAAGLCVWDFDIASDRLIWSEQQRRWRQSGPQPAQIANDTWCNAIHPEDLGRVQHEIIEAIIDSARPFDAVYRTLRSDGVTRWLQVKASVVRDQRGKPLRMVGLTMDVTETRETEAQLRRLTADLEARVQQEIKAREAAQIRAAHAGRMLALGRLAGGIAHDFNNVLQIVLIASTLIEADAGNPNEVRRLGRLITEATEHGGATIRRLLTVGRHVSLQAEDVDVGAMLHSLQEMIALTLGPSVAVHVRVENGLPMLRADRVQLQTSLLNLVANARDAMPEGGQLFIAARAETIYAENGVDPVGLVAGRYIRLAVSDTGSGMHRSVLEDVGKPFFTTKQPGPGTGLGVAIVKSFAEQSGGGISIESQLGTGSTVTLWLPAADDSMQNLPQPEVTAQPAAGAIAIAGDDERDFPRVLLVDDEPAVRRVLAQHLQRSGFQVVVAADAAEGLAILVAGTRIDALVTDLSMRGMNGLALIRAAQECRPGLPAVLLTGCAEDGVSLAIDGAIHNAYSLLRKPITGAQLATRVRALLFGRIDAGF